MYLPDQIFVIFFMYLTFLISSRCHHGSIGLLGYYPNDVLHSCILVVQLHLVQLNYFERGYFCFGNRRYLANPKF